MACLTDTISKLSNLFLAGKARHMALHIPTSKHFTLCCLRNQTWPLVICFLISGFPIDAQGQLKSPNTIPSNSAVAPFLSNYCAACHTGEFAEGDFFFSETSPINWNQSENVELWENVYTMVSRKLMPYPDSDQPTPAERNEFLSWLNHRLMQHGRLGGTVLRRLSRREYSNTIRSVFGFRRFEVSDDFPPDSTFQGFDNHGESMFTAPGHLEALVTNAVAVADRIFPQPAASTQPKQTKLPADDLVISYSSAFPINGTLRLASSGSNYRRNATWPTRFEAPVKGVYHVRIVAEAINPAEGHVPEIRLGTMKDNISIKEEVELQTLPLNGIQDVDFEVTLDQGQNISVLYANGEFRYEDKQDFAVFLTSFFTEHPDIAAAWDKVGQPARGGSGWKQVQHELKQGNLPTEDYSPASSKFKKLVKRLSSQNVNTGETLVYRFFQEGPAVAIHEVIIDGPLKVIPSATQLKQQQDRDKWVQQWNTAAGSNRIDLKMQILLTKLFRRPATEEEVQRYCDLVREETNRTQSESEGWHLALRTALISPSFLYRSVGKQTKLSPSHLANRLAYFLTSACPDDTLTELTANNEVTKLSVLKKQTRRLINNTFISDFTDQWLHLSALNSLMPDARLMPNFTDKHRDAMRLEVTKTFSHVLHKNLPVTELIAPDFIFVNTVLGKDIYQLPDFPEKKKGRSNTWTEVSVDRMGHRGGLLCMPAVNMATANGVDTQPVLRGVWMLENILGTPSPEPPDAVPALTPDTSAATTVKERLAAHMSDATCASCHAEIDPVGFVLENFDPVGRWRNHYPVYEKAKKGRKQTVVVKNGLAVDATGVMPDGTTLKNVSDLKSWLLKHPETFACCLGEKLMTYATGRRLSYRERSIIREIVTEQQRKASNGQLLLKDLLVELVASEVFLTP